MCIVTQHILASYIKVSNFSVLKTKYNYTSLVGEILLTCTKNSALILVNFNYNQHFPWPTFPNYGPNILLLVSYIYGKFLVHLTSVISTSVVFLKIHAYLYNSTMHSQTKFGSTGGTSTALKSHCDLGLILILKGFSPVSLPPYKPTPQYVVSMVGP